MKETLSQSEIRHLLKNALPNPNDYRIVLEMFAAGIQRAGSHGNDRWALKLKRSEPPTMRLYVGPVIIQSLVPSGLWLSFDRESAGELSRSSPLLEYLSTDSGGEFEEYPEYPTIDSKNLYFFPSGLRWEDFSTRLLPDIEMVHLPAIDRAAKRNKDGVGYRTGKGHQPELVDFLEAELGITLPAAKVWENPAEGSPGASLAGLDSKKKTTITVNLDSKEFSIRLYENPGWIFNVREEYAERLESLGLYNDKGKRRVTGPQSDPEKQTELERLASFLGANRIPLAEAFKERQRLDRPRLLEGPQRRKEIVKILNRFDAAFYREMAKRPSHT